MGDTIKNNDTAVFLPTSYSNHHHHHHNHLYSTTYYSYSYFHNDVSNVAITTTTSPKLLSPRLARCAVFVLFSIIISISIASTIVFVLTSVFSVNNSQCHFANDQQLLNKDNNNNNNNNNNLAFIVCLWPQFLPLPKQNYHHFSNKHQQLNNQHNQEPPSVAVLVVATGRYYDEFVKNLIESARKYFCKSCQVKYFIFTDSNRTEDYLPQSQWPDVVHLRQVQLGWPLDSLFRFTIYQRFYENYKNFDFVVSMDVDVVFVSQVDRELLGDLVGVLHPGFSALTRGSYEEAHVNSTAYVLPYEGGSNYFTGGLWAASNANFPKLIGQLSEAVTRDLKSGIIAIWHDESHLNRYFLDHKPTTILSPAYYYPANWSRDASLGHQLKILALNKTNQAVRQYQWINAK